MLLTATADETNKRSAMHTSLYLNIDSPVYLILLLFFLWNMVSQYHSMYIAVPIPCITFSRKGCTLEYMQHKMA